MKFEIDLELLKKTKTIRRCLCDSKCQCPCNEFLKKHICKCGIYKKIE